MFIPTSSTNNVKHWDQCHRPKIQELLRKFSRISSVVTYQEIIMKWGLLRLYNLE